MVDQYIISLPHSEIISLLTVLRALVYLYELFLTHLCRMEFPPLSIGKTHFCFKGYWVIFFTFIKILTEYLKANSGDFDQTPRSWLRQITMQNINDCASIIYENMPVFHVKIQ